MKQSKLMYNITIGKLIKLSNCFVNPKALPWKLILLKLFVFTFIVSFGCQLMNIFLHIGYYLIGTFIVDSENIEKFSLTFEKFWCLREENKTNEQKFIKISYFIMKYGYVLSGALLLFGFIISPLLLCFPFGIPNYHHTFGTH